MQDAVIPTLASNLGGLFEGTLPPAERNGNRHGGMAMCPYNVYEALDGWVAIFCVTDAHWSTLCGVLGRADLAADARLISTPARVAAAEDIDQAVEGWTRMRTESDIVQRLRSVGIPTAEVKQLKQLVVDPQVQARGMLPTHSHPTMGDVHYFGTPIRVGTPNAGGLGPAPLLGQHTRDVLSSYLGLEPAAIDDLKAEGVV